MGPDPGGSRPPSSARCWQVQLAWPSDTPQSPIEVGHQLRCPCPLALRLSQPRGPGEAHCSPARNRLDTPSLELNLRGVWHLEGLCVGLGGLLLVCLLLFWRLARMYENAMFLHSPTR